MAERYLKAKGRKDLEVWKFNRRVRTVTAGTTLRIQAPAPFRLHWTLQEWKSVKDTEAMSTAVGIHFVDIRIPKGQKAPVRFTFYWPAVDRWEGQDFQVHVRGNDSVA